MAETRDQKCEDRIAEAMRRREGWIKGHYDLLAGYFNTDDARAIREELNMDDFGADAKDDERAYESLNELPLGYSIKAVVRIELSTGGPGDWLEVVGEHGRHGFEVETVTYHYADWFDHAERPVDEGSALWQYAESFVEVL